MVQLRLKARYPTAKIELKQMAKIAMVNLDLRLSELNTGIVVYDPFAMTLAMVVHDIHP
ncbi:MAG: hypothetical protein ETSY1_23990 [Candidatus Entotheonella factor]|uniref:Uncharacterized protein n=1 Tax=Entotheonella factor TaxID=1429438 RepID=W4LGG5_ENTF1|nr:MAG: hypothetical protein ETSY1_23990 [Candidatus Entotheonella factor]